MRTCETCRHWDQANYTSDVSGCFDGSKRLGCCQRVYAEVGHSEPLVEMVGVAMHPSERLVTRADFGCIAHEPRE